MCMDMCMDMCIDICTPMLLSMYRHVYRHACRHVCRRAACRWQTLIIGKSYLCIDMCVRVDTYTDISPGMHTDLCMRTCTNMCTTCIQICVQTCVQTCVQACVRLGMDVEMKAAAPTKGLRVLAVISSINSSVDVSHGPLAAGCVTSIVREMLMTVKIMNEYR